MGLKPSSNVIDDSTYKRAKQASSFALNAKTTTNLYKTKDFFFTAKKKFYTELVKQKKNVINFNHFWRLYLIKLVDEIIIESLINNERHGYINTIIQWQY